MVIFVKPSGETVVSNNPIGAGSKLTDVIIVAPTMAGAAVELLIEPPSGVYIPPVVCAPMLSDDYDVNGVYVAQLSESVTTTPGTASYQVKFTHTDGAVTATPRGTFTIQRGVFTYPSNSPDSDVYRQILGALSLVNANYAEIANRIDSVNDAKQYRDEAEQFALSADDDARRAIDAAYIANNALEGARGYALKADEHAARSATSANEAKQTLDSMRTYLSQIPKFGTKVVPALPTTNISPTTVYMVKEGDEPIDLFTEYLFVPSNPDELRTEYDESEGVWESVGGRAGSVAAPGFDLYALGLPDVALDGGEKSLSTNTDDLMEAATSGPVRLSLVVGGSYTTIVANAIVRGSVAEIVKDIDPYHTLSVTVAASRISAKVTPVEDRFTKIEGDIADLLYKEITVTSFTTSVATAELGSTVNNVALTWKLNKKPVSLTIDGAAQAAVAEGSLSLTGLGLTATKKWTLKATDERGAVATKENSLSFYNGVYYGVGSAQSAYTSEFIRGLTKTLRSNKLPSFTVNAGEGQYIYYCLPTRYGACTFTVGGFEGGFELMATMNFENASGYKENYYIYRSTNAGLGNTTVGVT